MWNQMRRLTIALAFIFTACMPLWAAAEDAPPTNLFPNPSAEEGGEMPNQWNHFTNDDTTFARDASVGHTGSASARIIVGPKGAAGFPSFNYMFEQVKPGEEYSVSVWVKGQGVKNNWGPNMTVIFFQGDKRLEPDISGDDIGGGDRDWTQLNTLAIAPKEADRMLVVMGLYGEGTAWFDDVSVVRTNVMHALYEGSELSLSVQEDKVLNEHFIGFGAHGDYFLTTPRNIKRGVDDRDREMINRRIESMRPGVILVFFNFKWWEPEEGKQTPDSDEMKDLAYWLRFLQSIGTTVVLTPWGDNFAYADWMGWDLSKFPSREGGPSASLAPKLPPAEKQPAVMRSLADAVQYLRKDVGVTNLKYISICCEPDNDNIRRTDPEEFVGMLRMLDKELRARNLREDVQLLGPHASGGGATSVSRYIKETMPLGKDVMDVMTVHTYSHQDTRLLPYWLRSRMDYLKQLEPSKPAKPLMIAEFGYGGGTFENTENHKYEYGLFLADFGIVAAREGASAVLMWCLMDTYYPVERPDGDEPKQLYGLWRFRDEGWRPRPGYFSWSLVNRYTKPDSKVIAVDVQPQAESVPAVAFLSPQGELTVMMANRGGQDIQVNLQAGASHDRTLRRYEYSEQTVPTPEGMMIGASGVLRAQAGKTVTVALPARSFVLLTDMER